MIIFPAIDIFDGKAVRLFKGDYSKMTVYSNKPGAVALDFVSSGASHIHIVDLNGAKSGETDNFDTVKGIKDISGAFCEIGGGIRSLETVEKYISAGLDRVILGTAALNDESFLKEAVYKFGDKIAVGIDMKDGYAAINGWTERSLIDGFEFCKKMESLGVGTIICTDISKDGAMKGTNRSLYERLSASLNIRIVASGGISSLEDVKYLKNLGLYGAIIGKAYYTGAINIREAIEVAK